MDRKNPGPISAGGGRNYGIDALRLLSMLMIVMIHILGQGGVEAHAVGLNHNVASLMDVFVVCCVDIFAIISGYVGYREEERRQKSSKYLTMWIQVFFYSAGISSLAFLLTPAEISKAAIMKSFFPVVTGRYWYFSSYTVVFFLAPWVNKLLRSLSKTDLTKLVWLLFGLFSIWNLVTSSIDTDPFTLADGYSAIWLLALYVIGAWIKKNEVLQTVGKCKLFLLLIGSYVLTVGIKFVIPQLYGIVSYTSPTVLATSVLFVVLFSKLQFPRFCNKAIAFLAPAAFGVYLIHTQPFVFGHIFKGAFTWIADDSFVLIPFEVVGCALCVMAICLAIEKIRLFLFEVTRFNRLIAWVGQKIDNTIDKVFVPK